MNTAIPILVALIEAACNAISKYQDMSAEEQAAQLSTASAALDVLKGTAQATKTTHDERTAETERVISDASK